MSRFMSEGHRGLKAYVPGEQPQDMAYIKLNTNESPFPPSDAVIKAVRSEAARLQLYSDPECSSLAQSMADYYKVKREQIIMTNGSDEALEYIFQAFGDRFKTFAFPDITYGFYPVFAQLYGIPYEEIPLQRNFGIAPEDYVDIGKNIVIANPNAHTGIALSRSAIKRILATNREYVVVIDEAYIDFGGESVIPLIDDYDNLIVTGTFSKSYSLAGARLGFCVSNKEIIKDLNIIKYSKNPYNVNRMTMAAGKAALDDKEYHMENCRKIINNREFLKKELNHRGFTVTDSHANFILISHGEVSGMEMFTELRKKGYLVRHPDALRLENWNRITIGTMEDMKGLIRAVDEIIDKKSMEEKNEIK